MNTSRIIYSLHIRDNKVLCKPVAPFTSKQCELSDGAYIEVNKDKSICDISVVDMISDPWLKLST